MPSLRNVALGLFLVWIFADAAVVFRWRTGAPENRDRGSLGWIAIGSTIVWTLAIRWAFGRAGAIEEPGVQWAGLGAMAAGIALRFVAITELGRLHTPNVAVRADHVLVDRGLYRHLRHPSYLGALIAFAGFGLALGNWRSALILAAGMPLPYLLRIREEEAALAAAFGETYAAYRRRTRRLIPWIY